MSPARGSAMDVVVVGAGPAGLSAAVAAAEHGSRVLVLDAGLRPGGQIWRHRSPASLPSVARDLLARAHSAGVTVAARASVIDVLSPSELVVDFGGRIDRQHTGALVLATGARERMVPFPGWTLPGVVGIGGLQALLKSGVELAGARVVIAGSGPLLFPVAAAVADAGAELLLVAEQASWASVVRFGKSLAGKPGAIAAAMRYRWKFRRAPYRTSTWAVGAEGSDRLRHAVVNDNGEPRTLSCDWFAVGAGLVPNTEVAVLAGCAIANGAIKVGPAQATTVPGVWAAGECTGVKGDAAAIAEGAIAGLAATGDLGAAQRASLQRRRNAGRIFGEQLANAFALRPELLEIATAETLLCRCEDVTRGDIDPRWTQRQAKLWTRIGMGECQGAICGSACAALFGWDTNAVRPPLGTPSCERWAAAIQEPE